jgi:hypothetical protein
VRDEVTTVMFDWVQHRLLTGLKERLPELPGVKRLTARALSQAETHIVVEMEDERLRFFTVTVVERQ